MLLCVCVFVCVCVFAGRIVYFMVMGVTLGVFLAMVVVVVAITVLVCRSKAAQKRKRTFCEWE